MRPPHIKLYQPIVLHTIAKTRVFCIKYYYDRAAEFLRYFAFSLNPNIKPDIFKYIKRKNVLSLGHRHPFHLHTGAPPVQGSGTERVTHGGPKHHWLDSPEKVEVD